MAGQKKDGTTVNATVSTNAAGTDIISFTSPFSMSIALDVSTGVIVKGTADNNRFLLDASTSDTIDGGAGNDLFVVSKGAVDLGGDVLHGGAGVNIVQLMGSGTEVDLTGLQAQTSASTGISAVVSARTQTGEIVDLNLSQIGATGLTNGGAGPGSAFVALIGVDGTVNLTTPKAATLVGIMNAAGVGFDANGNPLDAATTAALAADVTPVTNILGTLASMHTGSTKPTAMQTVANSLNAYVFSVGANLYTVWSDGTVNQIDAAGGGTLYQAAASTSTITQFGVVPLYDPTTGASATITTTAGGLNSLSLGTDAPDATGAIILKAGVTGMVIHGDKGTNGGDWYSLAGSGGGNVIDGTTGNDVFDLGNSTSLIDTIDGRGGFDIVHAGADGADVDLTGLANGIPRSSGISGVVGSLSGTQTVEVNLSNLTVATDASGNKTSVFEALLGSSADTLTLSGSSKWEQIATITPGDPLPTGATALTDPTALDAVYNKATSMRAETTMVGDVFELLGAGGVAVRYATVWTDATVVSPFVQAMAQVTTSSALNASVITPPETDTPPTPLTTPGVTA